MRDCLQSVIVQTKYDGGYDRDDVAADNAVRCDSFEQQSSQWLKGVCHMCSHVMRRGSAATTSQKLLEALCHIHVSCPQNGSLCSKACGANHCVNQESFHVDIGSAEKLLFREARHNNCSTKTN